MKQELITQQINLKELIENKIKEIQQQQIKQIEYKSQHKEVVFFNEKELNGLINKSFLEVEAYNNKIKQINDILELKKNKSKCKFFGLRLPTTKNIDRYLSIVIGFKEFKNQYEETQTEIKDINTKNVYMDFWNRKDLNNYLNEITNRFKSFLIQQQDLINNEVIKKQYKEIPKKEIPNYETELNENQINKFLGFKLISINLSKHKKKHLKQKYKNKDCSNNKNKKIKSELKKYETEVFLKKVIRNYNRININAIKKISDLFNCNITFNFLENFLNLNKWFLNNYKIYEKVLYDSDLSETEINSIMGNGIKSIKPKTILRFFKGFNNCIGFIDNKKINPISINLWDNRLQYNVYKPLKNEEYTTKEINTTINENTLFLNGYFGIWVYGGIAIKERIPELLEVTQQQQELKDFKQIVYNSIGYGNKPIKGDKIKHYKLNMELVNKVYGSIENLRNNKIEVV